MPIASPLSFTAPPRNPDRPVRLLGRLLGRSRRRILSLLNRERIRLRAHFREVLAELSGRDVSHLSGAQAAMRRELLAVLARYARAGRFPRNLDFPGKQVPYFIDAFGTRCAMAHLIESSGAAALVASVAGAMNNARVHELAGEPAVTAWLDQAGLTADEAARIQPSYCFIPKSQQCFCREAANPVGVLEGTVLSKANSFDTRVRIEAIHGNGGETAVGQLMTVSAYAEVNDTVLIQVQTDAQMRNSFGNVHRLGADGNVAFQCQLDIPTLTKADAIAAMFLRQGSFGSMSECSEYLKKLDAKWGEPMCEHPIEPRSDGGCSVGSSPGGSPLLLGAALVLGAAWSWRRRPRAARRRLLRPT